MIKKTVLKIVRKTVVSVEARTRTNQPKITVPNFFFFFFYESERNGSVKRPWVWNYWPRPATTHRCNECTARATLTAGRTHRRRRDRTRRRPPPPRQRPPPWTFITGRRPWQRSSKSRFPIGSTRVTWAPLAPPLFLRHHHSPRAILAWARCWALRPRPDWARWPPPPRPFHRSTLRPPIAVNLRLNFSLINLHMNLAIAIGLRRFQYEFWSVFSSPIGRVVYVSYYIINIAW